MAEQSVGAHGETAARRSHSAVREGFIAGVIGATAVAAWFFVVDLVNGHPLYTPTVLGGALFSLFGPKGSEGAAVQVVGYTIFHYAAFVAVGMLLTVLVHQSHRQPHILAGLLILFVAFELGFYGLTALLSESRQLGDLAWYQIGVANLIAAALMGTYIWRTHPGLGRNLSYVLRGQE